MPSISRGSITRSRRRQTSEDNIEDGDPSQRSRTEDVEDAEEEQPSVRVSKENAKASKKKRANSKRKHTDESDDRQPEDNSKEAFAVAIDIQNFQDKPLSKTDARKISALAADWEQIKRNLRTATFPQAEQVAVAMAEAGESKDGEEALQDLEETDLLMRELLDVQAELSAHADTLAGITNDVIRGEEIDNVLKRYTIGVDDRLESWQIKTTRQKYGKDEDYKKFKSSIYEVQHPDQGMPPLTSLITAEEGDDSDDEEIAVGGVSQVYTCPLTLTILVKPVTSEICKHTFSQASIEEYLNHNRSLRKKCPAAGCSKLVCLSDFRPNPELERKVQAHVRREQRRQAEADSEDEAVEEIID
ncbi:hypothetical protein A7U60_g7895 [Sanghuangporus baumii]|uniref:SP-RING-type domain-containing protein n=1 Tax=Sanghuangporus baumii TaxID=108892 RepID=A0A9Q5HS08_SANBA|nr:hypothetical protein A7U60_g7895 [Sanghuangporus baumii]